MSNEGEHLLHFQYQGNSELSVPAEIEYFSHLESWLDEICDRIDANTETRTQLQIAADEVFTNVCTYAYPEPSDGKTFCMTCSFDPERGDLILVFSDRGVDFNPLTHVGSPIPRNHRKGGVGLLMLRNFADSLHYERNDGHNVLTLRKKISEKGTVVIK